jgi:TonB-dependent receptor
VNVFRPLCRATLVVAGTLLAAPRPVLAQLALTATAAPAERGRAPVEEFGTVVGRVTDGTGRGLVGAQLSLEGRREIVAVATSDGRFRARVPAGTQRLVARYLGYRNVTQTVTVRAGAVTTLDFRLAEAVTTLSAVTVQGQRAGQAAALNQQQAQDVVGNVVDNELVGRLPDQNLAEALQRVPGVAMVRDQGEGRFVQIRGIDANLNGLSVNGERVATPEQNARRVPMDVIPAEQLARIEVSKTLLPDMDADAIGGTVNLVTRTAQGGRPLFSVSGATGGNEINGGRARNASVNYGQRFGASEKFGISVGGTTWENGRGSENWEGQWCALTIATPGANPAGCRGVSNDNALNVPARIELRDYPQVNRTRRGANATLDYRFSPLSSVALRAMWNSFDDDEIRYRTRFGLSDGTFNPVIGGASGTVAGATALRDVRLRAVEQTMQSLQLTGRHARASGLALDWTASYARATEDRPDVITMSFRQTGLNYAYNLTRPDEPLVTGADSASTVRFDDPTRFAYRDITRETRATRDRDYAGRVNLAIPFGESFVLKVGGAARSKRRTNRIDLPAFRGFRSGVTAPASNLAALSTAGDTTDGYFDGAFQFGRRANPGLVREFVTSNAALLAPRTAETIIGNATNDFDVNEDVQAAYAMATWDIGRLRLIPGVRVERSEISNSANDVRRTTIGGVDTVLVAPVRGSRTFTNVFPGVTARFNVDRQTVVRAAVTTAIFRPNFRDFVPYRFAQTGEPVGERGNPDLNPTTSVNLDLSVERYFSDVGVLSAGVFAKRLRNPIFPTQRAVTPDDQFPDDVVSVLQPLNGTTASLEGFEVAWLQNLTFLPAPLNGLGVNVNYTYTRSRATYPVRTGQRFPLPGQTEQAGNVGVFYDWSRLSVRLGVNYAGSFLQNVGSEARNDIFVAPRTQVDLAATFAITPQVKLFAEANNLTNQPLRNYASRTDRGAEPAFEFYQRWALVGIRIQP